MIRIRLAGMVTVAAAAVTMLGAGCSSTPATTTSSQGSQIIPLLREGASTDFSNLSEQYADDYVSANWFDNLLKVGPDNQVEPWLAKSVTEQSPTVYVYQLRHGVKFWDGDEMTSADVVNALNYYRSPGLRSTADYTSVQAITASGPYTVVVTLKHPDASWIYELGLTGGIFEKKFQQEHGTAMGQPGVGVMTTGAFEVQSFDPTTGLELTANPHYWAGKVPVQHISLKFFADDTSMALAFRAGDIDLAFPQSAQQFSSPCGCHVISAPSDTSAGIAMNVTLPPWNNIHVRRAVAYAVQRSAEIAASGDNSTRTRSYTVMATGRTAHARIGKTRSAR